jgi:hypothetical protein
MHLRDLVKQRWADAGLYARKDAHLQSFLTHFDAAPLDSWEDHAALFRHDYYDLFDQLLPPLIGVNDKLLHVGLIRYADFSQPKELEAARQYIRRADPVADRPELTELFRRGGAAFGKDFLARPELKEIIEPKATLVRTPTNTVRQVPGAVKRKKRRPR